VIRTDFGPPAGSALMQRPAEHAVDARQRPRGCPWPSRSCPARWPCGFYGIVVVFLCALVKTHRSFGVSRIFAFTVPGIMADSSLPEAHFSALYGGATLAGASLQFKWGRLIDRYGSRIALPCFILMLGLGLAAITACGGELGAANYPLLFVGFTVTFSLSLSLFSDSL
jgi:MFS family permease